MILKNKEDGSVITIPCVPKSKNVVEDTDKLKQMEADNVEVIAQDLIDKIINIARTIRKEQCEM